MLNVLIKIVLKILVLRRDLSITSAAEISVVLIPVDYFEEAR